MNDTPLSLNGKLAMAEHCWRTADTNRTISLLVSAIFQLEDLILSGRDGTTSPTSPCPAPEISFKQAREVMTKAFADKLPNSVWWSYMANISMLMFDTTPVTTSGKLSIHWCNSMAERMMNLIFDCGIPGKTQSEVIPEVIRDSLDDRIRGALRDYFNTTLKCEIQNQDIKDDLVKSLVNVVTEAAYPKPKRNPGDGQK